MELFPNSEYTGRFRLLVRSYSLGYAQKIMT